MGILDNRLLFKRLVFMPFDHFLLHFVKFIYRPIETIAHTTRIMDIDEQTFYGCHAPFFIAGRIGDVHIEQLIAYLPVIKPVLCKPIENHFDDFGFFRHDFKGNLLSVLFYIITVNAMTAKKIALL